MITHVLPHSIYTCSYRLLHLYLWYLTDFLAEEYFLIHKAGICKNWPPVDFIIKTKCVAAFSHLAQLAVHLVVQSGSTVHQSTAGVVSMVSMLVKTVILDILLT